MANRRPLVLSSGVAAEIATGDSLTTSGGHLEVGAGGMGYGAGAGGAATQATSRTTTVILSKLTGAITLFSKTTTAGLVDTFTVTNTLVLASDTINVSVKTATGIYLCFVTNVAAGSFKISVYTPAAVGSAEAPIINFAVVRGSAS